MKLKHKTLKNIHKAVRLHDAVKEMVTSKPQNRKSSSCSNLFLYIFTN